MIVLMKSAFIVVGITNVILIRIIGIKNVEVEHKCQDTKNPTRTEWGWLEFSSSLCWARTSDPLINRRKLPLYNHILTNRLQAIKEIPLNICNGFYLLFKVTKIQLP